MAWLPVFLERASDALLDVYFLQANTHPEVVLRSLLPKARNIRMLSLRAEQTPVDVLLAPFSEGFPALEELHLVNALSNSASPLGTYRVSPDLFPRVQSLSLGCLRLPSKGFCFSALRHLELLVVQGGPTPYELLDVLRRSPELQTLTIWGGEALDGNPRDGSTHMGPSVVVLPKLEKLQLTYPQSTMPYLTDYVVVNEKCTVTIRHLFESVDSHYMARFAPRQTLFQRLLPRYTHLVLSFTGTFSLLLEPVANQDDHYFALEAASLQIFDPNHVGAYTSDIPQAWDTLMAACSSAPVTSVLMRNNTYATISVQMWESLFSRFRLMTTLELRPTTEHDLVPIEDPYALDHLFLALRSHDVAPATGGSVTGSVPASVRGGQLHTLTLHYFIFNRTWVDSLLDFLRDRISLGVPLTELVLSNAFPIGQGIWDVDVFQCLIGELTKLTILYVPLPVRYASRHSLA